jgi:hypothetical protein
MAKNGFSMSKRVAVEQITADKTLTVNDCGKTFIVDSVTQGSAVDITMPNRGTAEDGWNATFIMESGSGGGAAAQSVVWSGSAGDSTGTPFVVLGQNLTGDGTDGTSDNAATVTVPGTSLKNGDVVKVTMVDGNLTGKIWYVDAMTSGSITTT